MTAFDDVVGPFLRSRAVEARLGITARAVAARAARRSLLRVITSDGVHLYPAWQFDDGGLLPGLRDVLSVFAEDAIDGWTLAGWLCTRDPDLGEPPLETLRRGDVAITLAAALGLPRGDDIGPALKLLAVESHERLSHLLGEGNVDGV